MNLCGRGGGIKGLPLRGGSAGGFGRPVALPGPLGGGGPEPLGGGGGGLPTGVTTGRSDRVGRGLGSGPPGGGLGGGPGGFTNRMTAFG